MHQDRDLDRLLDEALQLPPEARRAFLDTRCGGDAEMLRTLEELLRESDRHDSVLKPGGAFDGPLWEDLLTDPPELTAGDRLGPYEVRDSIGAGGMGEVYRAHDTRLSRDVAIKVLPPSSGSRDALARFEREARAVAALNHPNILAIHDVGAEGSTPLRRHGAARGRNPAGTARRAGIARSGGSDSLRRADRAGPCRRARPRHRPPRPEAGERLHHARRPHQNPRLRHRDLRRRVHRDWRALAAHEDRAGNRVPSATCHPSSCSEEQRLRSPTCSPSVS